MLLICIAPVFAQNAPPTARVENITDEYFGQKIVDPYRWMEDLKADEMQKWMRGQADYADSYLKKLTLRDALLKRLNELTSARTRIGQVRQFGDEFYYYLYAPGDNFGKIMRRGVNDAPASARVLLDLNKMSADAGKSLGIGGYLPSPDGKYLAYDVYESGSELGETRVLEIATGKNLNIKIGNAAFPQSWLPDSSGFFYNRSEFDPKSLERAHKRRIRLHLLSGDADGKGDREVFGYGVNAEIEFPVVYKYYVLVPDGSRYAFGWATSGTGNNADYFYAPVESFKKSQPIKWRKIAALTDELFSTRDGEPKIEVRGDDLFVMTTKNAPLGKVVKINLKSPDAQRAETMFGNETELVNMIRAAKDALYVQTIEAGAYRLRRVDYRTKKHETVPIETGSSVYDLNGDAMHDGVVFGTDSYVKPGRYLNYVPQKKTLAATNLEVKSNAIDASNIRVRTADVKSHDGALVPIVILYKDGIKLTGANPTLINAYGAYGLSNLEPAFNALRLAWLERGGVYVFAGVRGGGERGEAWYRAGFQQTKPNTWKDLIAVAEFLNKEKYTSPKNLGIQGGSAGGIMISNAVATRPELFGAAIDEVGLNNTLRLEVMPNGAGNTVEFGSIKTEEGFKILLQMDGYHKVKPDVKYPAMLITHGANDPRVEPWQSAKYAARLQAANAGDKPILLRLNYDSGHGGGSTVQQFNEYQADVFAFLFEQLGGTLQ